MGAPRHRAKGASDRLAPSARALGFAHSADPGLPPAQGLYDPALDKDSCGVGFIADIKGRRSHKFFAKKADRLGFSLPKPGEYAVGALFMPRDPDWRQVIRDIYSQMIKREGMTLLGWREVPTDNSTLGESVKPTEPVHLQVFIGRGKRIKSETEFERRLYILRKSISHAIYTRKERRLSGYYPVSISCRTVVYKGMFLADQLCTYYPDLHDKDFESALALVHQRFSTNTFPTWSLAHPY